MTKTLAGASPVDQPVRPREVPLPGGLRLTVTERCELYDWRDACVAEAETAARMAGVHSVQEQTAGQRIGQDGQGHAQWVTGPQARSSTIYSPASAAISARLLRARSVADFS